MIKNINLQNSNAKKVIRNIIWLFFDKILRMGVGVFVIILLARYLGPKQFGLLNFTSALIALFGAFSALGLNAIVTRDLIVKEDKEKILASAFGLRILASTIAYIALIITIYYLRADDSLAKSLTIIIGFTLFFGSSDIIKYWFESQIISKYTVFVQNIAFLIFTIVKLILIFIEAPLIAFGYIITIEAFFVFIGLFCIYSWESKALKKWLFDIKEAKYLLSESWPLIISGMAWVIYTKIDQLMIGQMLDDTQVGFYSAASKLSEIANFFPVIITISVMPIILKAKRDNIELYKERFQQLYYLTVSLAVLMAVVVTFLSSFIIRTLYGEDYSASAQVLSIHFWIVVCTTLAVVSGKYLVNEGLQKLTMYRHLLGVMLNFPLNLFMIPRYGIEGAASASLFSLFLANYIFDLFDKKTQFVFIQKTKALLFWWVYTEIFTKFIFKNK